MAIILKSDQREFQENPNKIDNFRIFTDISRAKKGINPQNLNFDIRHLNPSQYSAPYHFHRYAEELFMIISGSATLRTPYGLEIVNSGDIIFFELGETGAHQLYNHTKDIRKEIDSQMDEARIKEIDKLLEAPYVEEIEV